MTGGHDSYCCDRNGSDWGTEIRVHGASPSIFLREDRQSTEELSSLQLCPRVMRPWLPCYGSRMSRLSEAKFHSIHVEQGKGQEDL